ncbi:MAG: hypothetical protein EAZ91_22465 [Cytophagales bacterium]|nr:MAG: hypothetical protein EAZ91_22465 [Cytophagales bacterium]
MPTLSLFNQALKMNAPPNSVKIFLQDGVVLDTLEWLTIKRYADRYGLKMNTVTNWISRGIIPVDCVVTIHELNDMRLIKNQPYR